MSEHGDVEENLSLLEALDSMSALRGEDPEAPRTILLLGFRGWNDAGEAATGVLKRVRDQTHSVKIHQILDEKFYDYQVIRPTVRRGSNGQRTIGWPGVRFYETGDASGRHRVIVGYGHEPSFNWKSYADQIMTFIAREHIDAVILLGSLLADTPHSRPLPTATTTDNRSLQKLIGLEQSMYEGPTGMIGVLSERFSRSGVPSVSTWVSVPHYVSHSPSPKAELSLFAALEELFGIVWNDPELASAAQQWEDNVNQLAESDSDIAEYVAKLERAVDAAVGSSLALPQVSGETIAKEFEQYLRSFSHDASPADDESPSSSDEPEGDSEEH
jgi:predicted ATP-grasp superfamily ATP-dependent carboligase